MTNSRYPAEFLAASISKGQCFLWVPALFAHIPAKGFTLFHLQYNQNRVICH